MCILEFETWEGVVSFGTNNYCINVLLLLSWLALYKLACDQKKTLNLFFLFISSLASIFSFICNKDNNRYSDQCQLHNKSMNLIRLNDSS